MNIIEHLAALDSLIVENTAPPATVKLRNYLSVIIEQAESEGNLPERMAKKEAEHTQTVAALQSENAILKKKLREATTQLSRQARPDEYLDWHGVLIKRLPGGGYSEMPFCPTCKVPLSVTPSKRLFCNHDGCGYLPHMTIVSFREHLKTLNCDQS